MALAEQIRAIKAARAAAAGGGSGLGAPPLPYSEDFLPSSDPTLLCLEAKRMHEEEVTLRRPTRPRFTAARLPQSQ